jgi:hypothetical protein
MQQFDFERVLALLTEFLGSFAYGFVTIVSEVCKNTLQ